MEEATANVDLHLTQFIERGEIGDVLVVSVPEATSQHAARQLQDELILKFPKRPILMVTHNVEFLEVAPATKAAYDAYVRKLTMVPKGVE